jgi:hypothetical protein
MKIAFLPVFILGLLAWPSTSSTSNEPVKATTPLSADEVAIYQAVLRHYIHDNQAFLRHYIGDKDAALNVSQTSYPLDPRSEISSFHREACLKGIQLENLSTASSSFHELTPEVLPDKQTKLVDPKKLTTVVQSNDPSRPIRRDQPVALFSMSEIAFDKEHRFGVVSYRFWCGNLCGNGSTLVFEKINGEWRNANRKCGGWIS